MTRALLYLQYRPWSPTLGTGMETCGVQQGTKGAEVLAAPAYLGSQGSKVWVLTPHLGTKVQQGIRSKIRSNVSRGPRDVSGCALTHPLIID